MCTIVCAPGALHVIAFPLQGFQVCKHTSMYRHVHRVVKSKASQTLIFQGLNLRPRGGPSDVIKHDTLSMTAELLKSMSFK